MATLTIRDLDPDVKQRLRERAARHGRSMEEEVRVTLRAAVSRPEPEPMRLARTIRERFEPFGGVELTLPRREAIRPPPEPE